MTVKVSAKLTKEEQAYNGLDPVRTRLCDDNDLMHAELYAVVKLHVTGIEFDVDSGEWNATVKLDHIEPDLTEGGKAARELLDELYRTRVGRPDAPPGTLPFGDGDGGEGPVAERPRDEWLDPEAREG